ncbi:MAG TPA: nucleotide exchange factor GrpE [Firmicutes bacterium]|nr:nucleotide exchange factor GrpE [Bacillota bacterium]
MQGRDDDVHDMAQCEEGATGRESPVTSQEAEPPVPEGEPEAGAQGEPPEEPKDALEERISALEAQLAEERRQKEYYLAGWQRTQADFENYKKRIEREREEMVRGITDAVLSNFLPVLDNLDAAFAFTSGGKEDDPVIKGIEMIKRQVAEFVERQGLKVIESLGKPFDPRYHEAMQQVVDDSVEEGTVVREVRRGYISHDRVLRPSLVVVSRKSQATGSI